LALPRPLPKGSTSALLPRTIGNDDQPEPLSGEDWKIEVVDQGECNPQPVRA
jgi:hypothetical protein